jgi:hypothetical protein
MGTHMFADDDEQVVDICSGREVRDLPSQHSRRVPSFLTHSIRGRIITAQDYTIRLSVFFCILDVDECGPAYNAGCDWDTDCLISCTRCTRLIPPGFSH